MFDAISLILHFSIDPLEINDFKRTALQHSALLRTKVLHEKREQLRAASTPHTCVRFRRFVRLGSRTLAKVFWVSV